MKTDTIILTSVFWIIAFFSFYKYFKIQRKINYMQEIKATCTDFIIKRTYSKKYYIFFYKTKINGEEFNFQDKTILPFYKNYFKINEDYKMYGNINDSNDYITPLEVSSYKIYLVISLILVIIPLILFR